MDASASQRCATEHSGANRAQNKDTRRERSSLIAGWYAINVWTEHCACTLVQRRIKIAHHVTGKESGLHAIPSTSHVAQNKSYFHRLLESLTSDKADILAKVIINGNSSGSFTESSQFCLECIELKFPAIPGCYVKGRNSVNQLGSELKTRDKVPSSPQQQPGSNDTPKTPDLANI